MTVRTASLVLAVFLAMTAGPAHADDLDLPGLSTDSELFAETLRKAHPAGATSASRALAEAEAAAAERKRDPSASVAALEDRLGMGEPDGQLWLSLARAELDQPHSDPSRALQAAWQAQAFLFNDAAGKAAAFGIMADALVAQKRPSQAGEALEQAVEAASGNPVYKARLAALSAASGLMVRKVRTETDADPPRACISFSMPPSRRNDFHAEDWITLSPVVKDAAITHEGDEICVSGLPLANTTTATIKAGMPGGDGVRLKQNAVVALILGDREPLLAFDNRMFLLPRGQAPRIVLTSTNIASVKIRIAYFSERTIQPWTMDNRLGTAIDGYVTGNLDTDSARIVWSGHAVIPHYAANLRQHVVLPLPADAMTLPGLYAVAVVPDDGHDRYSAQAVQPVLQTDLAPTVWRGADGLAIQVRGYSDAQPRSGVHLRLLAHNNDILAETETGADGFARFAAPLLQGTHEMAPATIQGTASSSGAPVDFVSLDLDSAAFDLSGRGTGGLPQPGPLDGFVWLDRGIYRPGETVQLMALLRDPGGQPITLPVRFRIRRPNGQIFFEGPAEATGDASVHLAATLSNGAASGIWTAELLIDPKQPPVGSAKFKVDAFVPDRMAVTLGALPASLVPAHAVQVPVTARFLYGAPAAGLTGTATISLGIGGDPPSILKGYQIGLTDEQFAPATLQADLPATDAKGMTSLALLLATAPDSTHPVQAHVDVVVNDPSGHGARAAADVPVRPSGPLIGVRPGFRDSVDAGSEAGFDVIAVDPDLHRIRLAAHLRLVRERPDWRLVTRGSLASFETVWRDEPLESRDVTIPESGTLHVGRRLDFGRYRLEMTQVNGLAGSSVRFRSGWSSSASPDVPDAADVSADRARYEAGDTAHVHVSAPFGGPATLLVVTDHVLSERNVDLAATGSDFDVKVDPSWGPGAYVAVHAYRPGGGARRPDRAIGLVWLALDPAARHLDTAFAAAPIARPGGVTHVHLHLQAGAWASIAAVDEGILRLTDFASPDPSAHYLGRRALGIDIRDDWGHLIAPAEGEAAALSQGGDEGGNDKPNIPQTILSLFQKPTQADSRGDIDIPLALPDFAGQVRLMAVSWNGIRLGSASSDMLVRDKLVAELLLPRFLGPGDSAQASLLLHN
ncbi:MAG: alpha-2-macroglobulin family protein, partial [Janthinobacterium lividum]